MSTSPDRTKIARIGLVLMGLSLLLGARILGLLPVVLSIFLPRFRVLGWWLTVVMTVLVLAVAAGGLFYMATNWSKFIFEQRTQTLYATGVISMALMSCGVTLYGLLAPGTRRAVERRTLEVAPHAFDEPLK